MSRLSGRHWPRLLLTVILVGLIVARTNPTQAGPNASGVIGGCQVFPSDNAWNQDISNWPVDPNSDNYVNSIGRAAPFHPDFGSDPTYGIPYVTVPGTQALVPITYDESANESDAGPFPIPLNAPVESATDGHVLVIDTGHCVLYELYHARQIGSGWTAGSGARFDLNSNALRTDGWTSADAAGLPIFPGLVRYDEATAASAAINHALRFTVPATQMAYIHPATHYTSSDTNPNLPPMGLRFRLKASFDISGFTGVSLVVLKALKKYGMFVADNGSPWYVSGVTNTSWDDNDLNQLKTLTGDAFEAVQSVNPGNTSSIGISNAGHYYLSRNNATVLTSFWFGPGGNWQSLAGDWNGNGVDSVGIVNGNEFYLTDNNSTVAQHFWFGPGGSWKPIVGDWDGNGTDTIGIGNGNEFYLSNNNSTVAQHFWFGPGGSWTPIAGDWDGNGTDTIGIVNGNEFYLSNNNSTVAQHFWFGPGGGWKPIVGDWDSSSTDTIGIVNGNEFYLSNNNSTVAQHFWFGPGGSWLPIIGKWGIGLGAVPSPLTPPPAPAFVPKK